MPADARYAIFFTPPNGSALQDFGRRWLESTPADASALTGGALSTDEIERTTAAPRRYGFHATLKAPFALAADTSPLALEAQLREFAQEIQPIKGSPLELSTLGDFLVLSPTRTAQDVDRLAASVVDRFDRFRAPLSEEDRRRREAARLTPTQAALLERWGYPYVFEEYRFHMTLSDALAPADRERMRAVLAPLVEPVCREPLVIDAITLVSQPDRESRFAPLVRLPFRAR